MGSVTRMHGANKAKGRAAHLASFFAGTEVSDESGLPQDVVKATWHSDPRTLIDIIRNGINPKVFVMFANSMNYSKEELGKALGLSVTTVDRKVKLGENLSPDQSERLVGMAKLIGQAQTMVEESGDPAGFDSARWVARWLNAPLPALAGQRPVEYMDTAEGRTFVSRLLETAQSGAYA